MGLNRVSNPAKLRWLSARVGAPVLAAYARFFEEQRLWLVFTTPTQAFEVCSRCGHVNPYRGGDYLVMDAAGRIAGIGIGDWPS